MRIAVDYDNTYSADPQLWSEFILSANASGHDCRIVTSRDDRYDRTAAIMEVERQFEVIYTRGTAKAWYCEHFVPDFQPDVWCDDKPASILENTRTSAIDLAKWRVERPDGSHVAPSCSCGGRCSC